MPRIKFSELLHLYHCTKFDENEASGEVYVSDLRAVEALRLLESDVEASDESQYSVVDDTKKIELGAKLRVTVGSPRLGLGILARHFDALLLTPSARVREPTNYFIVEGAVDRYTKSNSKLECYRAVLRMIALVAQAGAYMDQVAQEIVLIRDGKFVIPVLYAEADLNAVLSAKIEAFISMFVDHTHQSQKLAILAETLGRMCEGQPAKGRFRYILRNIDQVNQEVSDSYKAFVSDFSYAKIRNEIESAKIEYVNKIHKTFVDIQGQLLGIPVATIVVASQLKAASSCGVEFWTNFGVIFGSWVFLGLLLLAAANQWFTLKTIEMEVNRQRNKITTEHPEISSGLEKPFALIIRRVCYHKIMIVAIIGVAIMGLAFGMVAFMHLTSVNVIDCIDIDVLFRNFTTFLR